MTNRAANVVAVDLGASSGRVVVGRIRPDGMSMREVHRFPNTPVRVGGVLRTDVLAQFSGILDGLRKAEIAAGPLDAVGVDTWGVDYGLIDADGALLGNPAFYRDPRTGAAVSRVLRDLGAVDLYGTTGVQLQPFNTLFQLLTDRGGAQLRAAAHVLMLPDLMTYWLCGAMGTELTNASTTALLDPRTGTWSDALAHRLDVPITLFPAIRRPGETAAVVRADVAADAGIGTLPQVVTVPSHDTAAAVAGVPAGVSERFAFVCTGTWALVGVELPTPVITERARAANFTNEIGADGSILFLRNVTGFWLLQECVREWRAAGLEIDLAKLTSAAARVPAGRAVIDVQNSDFATSGDMPGRIVRASVRTSGVTPSGPAEVVRCILDSIAVAVRHAVSDAVTLSGRDVDVVHVVGGGAPSAPFCQAVADACDRPVMAGPAEAASWGNAIYQAAALGVIGRSLADARAFIRAAEPPIAYAPSGNVRPWQRADDMVYAARVPRS